MKWIMFVFLLLSVVDVGAQDGFCIRCVDNPYYHIPNRTKCVVDVTDEIVSSHLNKKLLHFNFHESMKQFRIPSTISPLANYRFHSNGYEKKPFVVDGDLNMPIGLRGPNGKTWMNTFQIIPRFKFRIFLNDDKIQYGTNGDESLPVRTPSAMPGVAWYITKHKWWTQDGQDPSSRWHDKYFGIYLYHHSNGQDGDELDTIGSTRRVNQYNGNFGEQVVAEFIMGGRFVWRGGEEEDEYEEEEDDFEPMSDAEKEKLNKCRAQIGSEHSVNIGAERKVYWTIGYEWRPDALTNEEFDKYDIYGKNRVKGSLTYTIAPTQMDFVSNGEQWCMVSPELPYEKFRHTLEWAYIVDANYKKGDISDLSDVGLFDLSKRLNLTYTFHWIPTGTQNLGLFGQVACLGSDEYNIYFQDSYLAIKAGLSFAFFNQPNPSNLKSLLN